MKPKKISDIRKQEIVESFYQVMKKEGFKGSSIAKIAKHMGVHPSLITHYYKKKDDLVLDLVDNLLSQYEEMYSVRFENVTDPEKRFHLLLDIVLGPDWGPLVDNRVFFECYSLSLRDERLKDRLKKMYMRFKKILIMEINSYMEHGVIREIDPNKAANLIISLVEGIDYYRNVLDDENRVQLDELRQYLKEIVVNALKKQ
jgi:AcrR family transcriptional regulator